MHFSKQLKLVSALILLLVVQISINLLVIDLSNQSEANLKDVEQARTIAEKLNAVKEDMHTLITVNGESALSSSDQMPAILKKWYEHITQDFTGLESACGDQTELRDRIVKMQDEVKKCVTTAGVVQNSFFETLDKKQDARTRSWQNIRYFANDLVDADFQVLDKKARARIETSAQLQAKLKERERQYLIAALLVDLLVVALVVVFVRKQVV